MYKRMAAVWLGLVLALAGCQPVATTEPSPDVTSAVPAVTAGYRAVTGWDMGFLAVGTDGQIDSVAADGTVTALPTSLTTHWNDVAVWDGVPVVVGEHGQMGKVVEGTFVSCAEETVSCDFYATVSFGDRWLVGGSEGTLLVYDVDGWTTVEFPVAMGNIVGLVANDERALGVTDTGMAFALLPDLTVTVTDVNEGREAEKTLAFTDVALVGATFWATAVCQDGSPAVLTSVYGGVWAERALNYADGAPFDPTGLQVHGLTASGGQAVVACNEGRLLTLPDCLQCNKLQTVGEGTLTDVAYHGGKLAAVGEGFTVVVTEAEAVAQYKISAETARQYMEAGAVLIDVREAADYAARHIAGSIHIPLAELATQLPERVPDFETPLIFYCAMGVRSQTAVEQALAMEYAYAYSLGSIDNWTYDFE